MNIAVHIGSVRIHKGGDLQTTGGINHYGPVLFIESTQNPGHNYPGTATGTESMPPGKPYRFFRFSF
jgi:hypothetical protein